MLRVESRLVESHGRDWTLKHGPFTEKDFLDLPERDWTLLVQGVDLWVPEVQELLAQFAFLPPWRLDDVMISFACPGGSVGPHFDQYDVFYSKSKAKDDGRLALNARGKRR